MRQDLQPVVIYPRKAGLVRILLGSIIALAIAVGAFLLVNAYIVELAARLPRAVGAIYGAIAFFFLAGCINFTLNLYRLIVCAPILVISAEGLTPLNYGLIFWEEVDQVINFSSQSLGIIPKDRDAFLSRLGWRNWLFAKIKDQKRPLVEIHQVLLSQSIDEILAEIDAFALTAGFRLATGSAARHPVG
jgi:hypothetical protein